MDIGDDYEYNYVYNYANNYADNYADNYTYNSGAPGVYCVMFLTVPLREFGNWNIVLYFIGLLYCFLGMAIIADIFMCSIEKILGITKVHLITTRDNKPEIIKVRFWNSSVANLTLLAFGSSAPEILLPIIEIVMSNFQAGDLGPSTIIGSAAFKFFVLTAICIMSIPKGEIRRIKEIKVFSVMAFFIFLAHVWLFVILLMVSAYVIELWETIVIILLLPSLVILAWLVENKVNSSTQIELGNLEPGETGKFHGGRQYFHNGQLNRTGLAAFIKEVKNHPGLTDEDVALLAAKKLLDSQSHSYMCYRVGGVRFMTGGRKIIPQLPTKLKEVYNAMNEHLEAPTPGDLPEANPSQDAVVTFHAASCAITEDMRKFQVTVYRTGHSDNTVKIRVEPIDGTATVVKDCLKFDETITFEPGEVEKHITVAIINDNKWNPDEQLSLRLTLLLNEEEHQNIQLGRISTMEIIILKDGEPGVVMFSNPSFLVKESAGIATIPVLRKKGADSNISVKWRTIDKTAANGTDFKGGEGVIEFKHSETEKSIEIPIISGMTQKDEHFEIELFDVEGGAKIGQISQTAVTITNDNDFNNLLSRVMVLTKANIDAVQVYHDSYRDQFKALLKVNGGDSKNASAVDYVMHSLTLPWKIIFSLIPPSGMLRGWLCFFISFPCIVVLTAIVLDLAYNFGCLIGLKNVVTGITFVSIGLSLPDIFALKTATVQEKYADNIVWNLTGNHAVNVLLGLGLSWFIASIYNNVQGNEFLVHPADLATCGFLFIGLSVVCILLLSLRRNTRVFGKAELGGPAAAKYISGIVMIFLWITFVVVIFLSAYHIIGI